MGRVFIIAEAGVNHNGEIRLAKKLIDIARQSGADAVKFQTFRTEKNISRRAPKADYQKDQQGESQFDMTKRLELKDEEFRELAQYCQKKKILFLSTPDDAPSVDLLDRLGITIFKIASGEVTNLPLLRKVGSLGKKIILSTGMADLQEVKAALKILVKSGTSLKKITLLHCTTEYPAPLAEANLRAMVMLREKLEVEVGYSDHTLGLEASIAAVALGASVIERHFTINKDLPGPDHKASLSPEELVRLVKTIRSVEQALGDGKKQISASELKNLPVIRRSIFAARDIHKGESFTEENIIAKRPGKGISPMQWDKVLGLRARQDFKEDEMIRL